MVTPQLERAPEADARAATPILPAHIEDTVRAIAELHAEHHRTATPVQRAVARLTSIVGRPRFVGVLTLVIVSWIGLNLGLRAMGAVAFDAPPFPWLQDVGAVLSLYITVLILITQRHDDQLSEHREQLTLELAILSEQKSAKMIELLEELRRDHPSSWIGSITRRTRWRNRPTRRRCSTRSRTATATCCRQTPVAVERGFL